MRSGLRQRLRGVASSAAHLPSALSAALASARGARHESLTRGASSLAVNVYGCEQHNCWQLTAETGSYLYMAPGVHAPR